MCDGKHDADSGPSVAGGDFEGNDSADATARPDTEPGEDVGQLGPQAAGGGGAEDATPKAAEGDTQHVEELHASDFTDETAVEATPSVLEDQTSAGSTTAQETPSTASGAAGTAAAQQKDKHVVAGLKKLMGRFGKKQLVAMLTVLAAAAIAIPLVVNFVVPQVRYSQATSALDAGDYDLAIAVFDDLGDYSDARYQAVIAREAKSYASGMEALEEERYADAVEFLRQAGDYQDAQDQLEEAKKAKAYSDADADAKSGNWKSAGTAFAKVSDYKDSAQRASDCAEELITTEEYSSASDILSALGDDYAERASYASDMASKADKVGVAESYLDSGELSRARDEYNELPDDFTYKGVSVATRKDQLAAVEGAIDACGTFKSADPCTLEVTQTSKTSGYWYNWEGDGVNSSNVCTVSGALNDDGTVTLSGTVKFARYTNFSTIGSLVNASVVTKEFSLTTKGAPSHVDVDSETSLTYDGSWHLNWKTVDTNHDVYFNYTYTASYTYKK